MNPRAPRLFRIGIAVVAILLATTTLVTRWDVLSNWNRWLQFIFIALFIVYGSTGISKKKNGAAE